jgi:hypothetical protein
MFTQYTMSQMALPQISLPLDDSLHNAGRSDKAPPFNPGSTHDSTALDLPQHIESRLARYNASDSVWRRWLFEIISWTTSGVCMVSKSRTVDSTNLIIDLMYFRELSLVF